jgi:hypothetical protein
MKLLKHIAAIVLTVLMLAPLVMPAFLQLQQTYVHWQMEEALEQKQLTTLSVSLHDIQWIEKGKECVIAGKLFDVKKMERNGDEMILTGLFDEKEKSIKDQISTISKKQNSSKQQVAAVKLFSVCAVTSELVEVPEPVSLIHNSCFPIFTQTYLTPSLSIVAPPPRC